MSERPDDEQNNYLIMYSAQALQWLEHSMVWGEQNQDLVDDDFVQDCFAARDDARRVLDRTIQRAFETFNS